MFQFWITFPEPAMETTARQPVVREEERRRWASTFWKKEWVVVERESEVSSFGREDRRRPENWGQAKDVEATAIAFNNESWRQLRWFAKGKMNEVKWTGTMTRDNRIEQEKPSALSRSSSTWGDLFYD